METLDAAEISPVPAHEPQRTFGFLEVMDRFGSVTERVRISALPICVGRAYDNDVIISDPYVCPHHLRVFLDANGQLLAEDLGSVNGTFVHGQNTPVARVSLGQGSRFKIGHTRLRFRRVDHQVGPTLPDHHRLKLLGVYENRLAQFTIFAITVGVLWLSNFMENVERRDAIEPAFDLMVPIAAILLWAGMWAFTGRVFAHQIKFLVHCAVICLALIAAVIFDTGLDYLAFALSVDESRSWLGIAGGLVIVVVMLYSHLRFATLASPFRLAGVATGVCVAIVGLMLLQGHIESRQFSMTPNYHVTLKAPAFRLVPSEAPGAFFTRLDELRDSVVASAGELAD